MDDIPTSIVCIEPDSGFRCLLSLLVFDDLLQRVSAAVSHPQRLPAPHVFDLIGGEGSGGIVALLVGRLGFSRASAPALLQQMMPKFCPWGGVKRKKDGTHKRYPFVAKLTQPMFRSLDKKALPEGGSAYYSKSCVKTVVLANIEGMPKAKTLSTRLKGWVDGIKTGSRILPFKLYSHFRFGSTYSNLFFTSEPVSDPSFSGPDPGALKERFRTYDATLCRPNVFISDVAQATFTHDNLVEPKTINGRSYGSRQPSTSCIIDIIDEANVIFPERKPGVVVRIGGAPVEDWNSVRLTRTGAGSEDVCFLGSGPGRNVFQIQLPQVEYEMGLIDDPNRVTAAFEAWRKKPDVVKLLDECANVLSQTVAARAVFFPGDAANDCV